jgi:hypothetical protein
MRTEGGDAVQLTKHKKAIHSYDWSEDESKIIFLADEKKALIEGRSVGPRLKHR